MKGWSAVAVVATALASCGGCVPHVGPPTVAVIPLTYEANRETHERCSYRGAAESSAEANSLNANLVVVFVRHGHIGVHAHTVVKRDDFKGKAVYCEPAVLESLLAKYTPPLKSAPGGKTP